MNTERHLALYLLPQIVLMSSSKTPRLATNGFFYENTRLQDKLQKAVMSFQISTMF